MRLASWLGVMTAMCVSAAAVAADGDRRIINRGGIRQIQLSRQAREAMTRYNPSFRVWSERAGSLASEKYGCMPKQH